MATIILNEEEFEDFLQQGGLESRAAYYKSLEPWFDERRGPDGHIDDIKIAKECLGYLKHSKGIFSPKHERIKLENGCSFFMRWDEIQKGDFSLWEIWVPGGGVIDGIFADEDMLPEDEGLAEEYLALDLDIQQELARHAVYGY